MEMQRPPERSFRLPFLREVQEARRCHGSASEETIAPGSPKPQGGRSQSKAEPDNCPVLVRPRRAKTSFPEARTTPLRSVVLSAPKIQKYSAMTCREHRAACGLCRSAACPVVGGDPPKAQTPKLVVISRG